MPEALLERPDASLALVFQLSMVGISIVWIAEGGARMLHLVSEEDSEHLILRSAG